MYPYSVGKVIGEYDSIPTVSSETTMLCSLMSLLSSNSGGHRHFIKSIMSLIFTQFLLRFGASQPWTGQHWVAVTVASVLICHIGIETSKLCTEAVLKFS